MGKIYRRRVIFVDAEIKRDRKLIISVKKWPLIYDKTDPLYFDANERRRIWEMIANDLQNTAQVCEERWETLVEIYENYETGTVILNEVLYEQLDDCLKRLSTNANLHEKEEILFGVNDVVEDNSLPPLQKCSSSFLVNSVNSHCGLKGKTVIKPQMDCNLLESKKSSSKRKRTENDDTLQFFADMNKDEEEECDLTALEPLDYFLSFKNYERKI